MDADKPRRSDRYYLPLAGWLLFCTPAVAVLAMPALHWLEHRYWPVSDRTRGLHSVLILAASASSCAAGAALVVRCRWRPGLAGLVFAAFLGAMIGSCATVLGWVVIGAALELSGFL